MNCVNGTGPCEAGDYVDNTTDNNNGPTQSGGGGGGGGSEPFIVEPWMVAWSNLMKAGPTARAALEKPDCAGLFGSGDKSPSQLLGKMILTATFEDAGTSYAARYNTITGSFKINTHTGPEGTYWNTTWDKQTIENAVTMLHEVGHEIGRAHV
jgi:hypothetical protein